MAVHGCINSSVSNHTLRVSICIYDICTHVGICLLSVGNTWKIIEIFYLCTAWQTILVGLKPSNLEVWKKRPIEQVQV